MKVLKFNLSGKTAFFKKPDVNTFYYFTYGNIHKIALMGILGSCLGLGGYNQQLQKDDYPEFYEKLKDLKISIVPKNEKGYVRKKVQIFNNSVGYASKEEGGNLLIKEQWLENPEWEIYMIIEDNEIGECIAKRFKSRKFVYLPYLGKNDHIANITNVEIFESNDITSILKCDKVDSFFIKDTFKFVKNIESKIDFSCSNNIQDFKYQEKLPYKLELSTNQYILETFIFTNSNVEKVDENVAVYSINGLNLCFI